MTRFLDWSRSASGRQYGLGAVDEGCLRIGGDGGFRMVSREQFMFLLPDLYHDRDRGQILTTTGAPSAFALVGACRRAVGKRSQLGEVFLSSTLELGTYNLPEYLCAFIAYL